MKYNRQAERQRWVQIELSEWAAICIEEEAESKPIFDLMDRMTGTPETFMPYWDELKGMADDLEWMDRYYYDHGPTSKASQIEYCWNMHDALENDHDPES